MKTFKGWGSHLPVLMKMVEMSRGPILELGGGLYSTPFLHWHCHYHNRKLVTLEGEPTYFKRLKQYQDTFHEVRLVDWDKETLEGDWAFAFVDHAPAERRIEEIKKLTQIPFVVVHDTEIRSKKHYNYESIYPLFKYHYKYRGAMPHTSVLSNFYEFKM